MMSWVDSKFATSRDRLYRDGEGTGWLPRGFLTYFAGPPDGKHAMMTETLVESVHEFSAAPIVVVHFGMHAPASWTPARFPRLVLLHAAPLPSARKRSFNFNKMRAMIFARIRTGVQLDADEFVAPGVDALFQRVEDEITAEYPFPILPVHFANRSPADQGKYWER